MTKFIQKVEMTTNVLIIGVSLLFGFILVQSYFFPRGTAKQASLAPIIGSKVNLPKEVWSNQSKTLILALQTSCHFCNESAPFYKRVIQAAEGKSINLVAVFPSNVDESSAHLKQLGLDAIAVRRSPLEDIFVGGTPTLILTNQDGEITDTWIGKLTPDREAEVLTKLNS